MAQVAERLDKMAAEIQKLKDDPLTKDRSASSLVRFMLDYHPEIRIESQEELFAACRAAYGDASEHLRFQNAFAIAWSERHSGSLHEVLDLFDDIVMTILS